MMIDSLPLPALILAGALIWLLLISLITFSAFRADKRYAIQGARRIPEARLLRLAMFGGWPAAKLAQRVYRHKTTKQPFGVYLNISGLVMAGFVTLLILLAASQSGRSLPASTLSDPVAGLWAALTGPGEAAAPEPVMPRRFGPGS